MKPDARKATDAQRGEAVVVLQPAELALHGRAATVEVAVPLSVPLDPRVEARRAFDDRHNDLLPALTLERDDRMDAAIGTQRGRGWSRSPCRARPSRGR